MVVFRVLGLLLDLLLLPFRLFRSSAAKPGTWLSLTVDGSVRDLVAPPRSLLRFWQDRAQKSVSLHRLDEAAIALIADTRIKGLVVTLASFDGGMAAATSLRAILARVRAAGKEVAVHFPMGAGSKEVYVATVANKVYLAPTSQIGPLGFRSGALYFKSALERAGVEPQVFSCGEFKSAGETLVRDSMSPQQRAQLERLLDGFHDALVDAVVVGRGLTKEQAVQTIDGAPYFRPRARRRPASSTTSRTKTKCPPRSAPRRWRISSTSSRISRVRSGGSSVACESRR